MVSVEPEAPQGPSGPSVQPCHVLTFSPIKIPVLASPFPGKVAPGGANEQLFMFTLQQRGAPECGFGCASLNIQGISAALL